MATNLQNTAHLTLGILGNIVSCAFFLSSAPTVCGIIKKKSTGALSGDLYVFKLFNCLLWIFYGLPMVHPNHFWVLLTNACGAGLALIYIVSYLCYASKRQKFIIVGELLVIVSLFALLVGLLLNLQRSQAVRILIAGTICAIISSFMHLSLLFQIKMVLQTKDTKYMYPFASLGAFLKGAIWTAYGAVEFDPFILVPNGVGILTGIFQCILFAILKLMAPTSEQSKLQYKLDFDQTSLVKCVEQCHSLKSIKVTDHNDLHDANHIKESHQPASNQV